VQSVEETSASYEERDVVVARSLDELRMKEPRARKRPVCREQARVERRDDDLSMRGARELSSDGAHGLEWGRDVVLDLHVETEASRSRLTEDLGEERYAGATPEIDPPQLAEIEFGRRARIVRDALEIRIVEHDDLPRLAGPNVDFDRVGAFGVSECDGFEGVLRERAAGASVADHGWTVRAAAEALRKDAAVGLVHGRGYVGRRSMSKSILVVDDDVAIARMYATALGTLGRVTVAANGAEALKLVAAETFDAVILDARMPGVGGLEVLDQIVAVSKTPVFLVTADQSETLRTEAMKRGAIFQLTKPVPIRVLVEQVRAQLERKASTRP
jgi:CheY-like chemotaxis protein